MNVLIVGATSGIGKELAYVLNKSGHILWLTGRNVSKITSDTALHGCVISSWDSANGVFDVTLPDVLDAVVYCPGSITLKPFNRLTKDDFLKEYEINVLGAVQVLQAALPSLKKSSHASVLLFSTVAVQTGMPFHASISAAKGAVEGLTRSLAAELAPTIRVNAIAPSLTDTPLAEKLLQSAEKREAASKKHPLQKVGSAAELAAMSAFLISPQAGWITGQIFHVDGGMSSLKLI